MGRPDWPGGLVAPIIWKRAARFRSLTALVTMAKSTKTFRIINAASGEPISGFPGYRSFSAAAREAGHLNGKIPSPTNPLFSAPISVGVFSA
jgi:hypothetical protein